MMMMMMMMMIIIIIIIIIQVSMLKSRLNSRSAHNKGNTKAKIRHKNSTNPRKQNTKRTKTIWKEKQYKEY